MTPKVEVLTVPEFAKACRIGESTVWRWLKLKRIKRAKFLRAGESKGAARIPRSELDKILAG